MNLKQLRNFVRWVRRNRKLIMLLTVITLVAILASCLGGDPGATWAIGTIIAGRAGGSHVVDGPLTTDLAREGSPSLLLNEIDQQITKIRPSSRLCPRRRRTFAKSSRCRWSKAPCKNSPTRK